MRRVSLYARGVYVVYVGERDARTRGFLFQSVGVGVLCSEKNVK